MRKYTTFILVALFCAACHADDVLHDSPVKVRNLDLRALREAQTKDLLLQPSKTTHKKHTQRFTFRLPHLPAKILSLKTLQPVTENFISNEQRGHALLAVAPKLNLYVIAADESLHWNIAPKPAAEPMDIAILSALPQRKPRYEEIGFHLCGTMGAIYTNVVLALPQGQVAPQITEVFYYPDDPLAGWQAMLRGIDGMDANTLGEPGHSASEGSMAHHYDIDELSDLMEELAYQDHNHAELRGKLIIMGR
jgi:hypothetical protein